MNIGIIQTLWTILVLVIFVGIVIWAWNGKRKRSFDRASRIPLEDDDSEVIEKNNNEGNSNA